MQQNNGNKNLYERAQITRWPNSLFKLYRECIQGNVIDEKT